MALLTRIRELVGHPGRTRGEEPHEVEAPAPPEGHDPFEAEILAHEIEAVDADTFTAGGDGVVVPTLPEATPSELYVEFDADQERPADQAP